MLCAATLCSNTNFRLFGYFLPASLLLPVSTIPATNYCDDTDVSGCRGRMRPPWKGASTDTSHTLTRGPWGRQNWFKTNFFNTCSHWQNKAFFDGDTLRQSNLARPDSTCKEKQSLLFATVCKEKKLPWTYWIFLFLPKESLRYFSVMSYKFSSAFVEK